MHQKSENLEVEEENLSGSEKDGKIGNGKSEFPEDKKGNLSPGKVEQFSEGDGNLLLKKISKKRKIPEVEEEEQQPKKRRKGLKEEETNKKTLTKKKTRTKISKVICCTGCTSEVQSTLHMIVKEMGDCRSQTEIDATTTHLVLGRNTRTLKTIVAISRGIHLVHHNWLTESWTAGIWLDEDTFPVGDWFPGARPSRLARETGEQLIFSDKTFFIGTKTSFPEKTLQEVIEALGGRVCRLMEGVDICISGCSLLPQIKNLSGAPPPVVTETWIFDALSNWVWPDITLYKPK